MFLEIALIGTVIVIGLALVYLNNRRNRHYQDYLKRKRVPECSEMAERVFGIIRDGLWYGANKQMLVSLIGNETEVDDAIDELLDAGRIKENTAIQPDGNIVNLPNWYVANCDLEVEGNMTDIHVQKTDNGVRFYGTPRTNSED